MSMQDFVGRGWQEHGENAEAVFDRLPDGLELIEEPGHALMLAALTVHVAGEHLGRWNEGLELLDGMLAAEAIAEEPARRALLRQKAVLQHCAGRGAERDRLLAQGRDPEHPEASSEVRVFAVATSALAGQGRMQEALESFRRTMVAAEYGPGPDDPAARSLAITCNNLACELEEKAELGADDRQLLKQAAEGARKYWEIAGDWTHVKQAEYRLVRTQLVLGEPERAIRHARAALALCDANEGGPSERFFPNEGLALALLAAGEPATARAARDEAEACLAGIDDEGFRDFCEAELAKLDAALGQAGAGGSAERSHSAL